MGFRKIILLLIGFANIPILYAQLPPSIVKASAFSQEVQMGNIPVDLDGKALNTGASKNYFVIIETKGNQIPVWKMAYLSGMAYTLNPTDSTQINNDTEMFASRGQIIKAAAGNRLWRYELVPTDLPQKKCSVKNGQIILEGNYKKNKITFPIKTITTLEPELRP